MKIKRETIEEKCTEAIGFLQGYRRYKEFDVFYSGGKDSTVILHLMKLSQIPYNIYYCSTGIDPPELIQFIRMTVPDVKVCRPRKSFWNDMGTHIVPSARLRWCCTALKKNPADRASKNFINVEGIRAEESSRRAKYPRANYFEKRNKMKLYPILYWTEADVWNFIDFYKLPYCSLYDEGFNRLGCVICPYHSEKQHLLYKERWPTYFKTFEKVVAKLYYKRVGQGRKMYYASPEEFIAAWYKNSNAFWYKGKPLPFSRER